MAVPALSTYSAATGQPIAGGRWPGGLLSGNVDLSDSIAAGALESSASDVAGSVTLAGVVAAGSLAGPLYPAFATITDLGADTLVPDSTPRPLVLIAHGSGSGIVSQQYGHKYKAQLASGYGYSEDTEFYWAVSYLNDGVITLRPSDGIWKGGVRTFESYWFGYTHANPGGGTDLFRPYRHSHLDGLINWVRENYPQASTTNVTWRGGSMGAWGGFIYALRRPQVFASLYGAMPRLRYANTTADAGARYILTVDWEDLFKYSYPITTPAGVPQIDPAFGSGPVSDLMDAVAYVSNAANDIPWLGWSVGWADQYTNRQDHVDFVAALRATGRGFAFAWVAGDHSQGDQLSQISASYPYGTFDITKGYPVFSEHSLDADPATASSGGINIGLKFRNVVETAGTWSCEVTHISSACTVKVKPKSPIYTGNPTPQLVTITSANSWVPVTF